MITLSFGNMRSISVQVCPPKAAFLTVYLTPCLKLEDIFKNSWCGFDYCVALYAGGVKSWHSLTAAVLSPTAGQLMGMNEITEKLTLDAKCRNEHSIVQRVTTAVNVSRVPCGSDKECRWVSGGRWQARMHQLERFRNPLRVSPHRRYPRVKELVGKCWNNWGKHRKVTGRAFSPSRLNRQITFV